MKQYWEIKTQHSDKIVLFRMGDFYEMFHRDAEVAAPLLGIQLTQRNKKAKDVTKMCGVPHHSIAGPIAKLLAQGHKVAVVEQTEDPKFAKGLVRREVTRILTPGMVYDPSTLNELSANYIVAYDNESLSAVDTSTGEAFFYQTKEVQRLIELLRPSEILVAHPQLHNEKTHLHLVPQDFGNLDLPLSARCVIHYLKSLNADVELIFEQRRLDRVLNLSPEALRALEIFENARGETSQTLFESMRQFKTSSGARLFRSWLKFPLLDLDEIDRRHNLIDLHIQDLSNLKDIRENLSYLGDVERKLSKALLLTSTARDLNNLKSSIEVGLKLNLDLKELKIIVDDIERTIEPDSPSNHKEGGYIKQDYSSELKELLSLSENSNQKLLEMESLLKEQTKISSLKIRYNSVFGFYIEVTNTHLEKVPSNFLRKQTLVNAERFTTKELEQLEVQILSAKTKRLELELQIFLDLKQKLKTSAQDILLAARKWAELDVVTTLAWLSIERKYTRPKFIKNNGLTLVHSRHPCLELTRGKTFTSNTIVIKPGQCLLLTGPNMAGKSTIMRQVALTVLLAQVGCFVPAEQAQISLVDGIFTRLGSSDQLSEGMSTFMVEMTETAEILRLATQDSLILLDEIGRGTSTYDGLSLAQSLLEHLVEHKKSFLLFATHYHELTSLKDRFKNISNRHMRIAEKNGHIEFLHTLAEGAAQKSYGLHVAKLAGVPTSVIARAQTLLKSFESQPQQLSLLETMQDQSLNDLKNKVLSLDLNQTTPMDALLKWKALQSECLDL